MLKYILLGFINYAPMTGYEIEQYISVSTGNFWHATLSQIYMTLKKLEEDGFLVSRLVPQVGKPDKRIYTITHAGRADLATWLDTPILEPIVKKDALLLKIFFASPAQKQTLLTQLRLQLDLHRRQLTRYQVEAAQKMVEITEANPQLYANMTLWDVTRQYGEMYEETYIRWIEQTIERLSRDLPNP